MGRSICACATGLCCGWPGGVVSWLCGSGAHGSCHLTDRVARFAIGCAFSRAAVFALFRSASITGSSSVTAHDAPCVVSVRALSCALGSALCTGCVASICLLVAVCRLSGTLIGLSVRVSA